MPTALIACSPKVDTLAVTSSKEHLVRSDLSTLYAAVLILFLSNVIVLTALVTFVKGLSIARCL